jgi:ribosomal protein S13
MQAELKQIRGIGDAMCERLGRDHGIETLAHLARLSDTEADELQQALRASGAHVRNGDVARWREQARQLLSDREAAADEPLATFVVEARKPVGEPDDKLHFVIHHIEADQTLETSAPKQTIDAVVRWMQERVSTAAASSATEAPVERGETGAPAGREGAPHPSEPEQPMPSAPERLARRCRLHITGLEIRHAGSSAINGVATSLLTGDPVSIEASGEVVFVGHVSVERAEDAVSCRMRCRLRRIDSGQDVSFTWGGEMTVTPGPHSASISSPPVSIPAGAYRGTLFAEDPNLGARRAFCDIPLLVVS